MELSHIINSSENPVPVIIHGGTSGLGKEDVFVESLGSREGLSGEITVFETDQPFVLDILEVASRTKDKVAIRLYIKQEEEWVNYGVSLNNYGSGRATISPERIVTSHITSMWTPLVFDDSAPTDGAVYKLSYRTPMNYANGFKLTIENTDENAQHIGVLLKGRIL